MLKSKWLCSDRAEASVALQRYRSPETDLKRVELFGGTGSRHVTDMAATTLSYLEVYFYFHGINSSSGTESSVFQKKINFIIITQVSHRM